MEFKICKKHINSNIKINNKIQLFLSKCIESSNYWFLFNLKSNKNHTQTNNKENNTKNSRHPQERN